MSEEEQISNEITEAILDDSNDEKIAELFGKLGESVKARLLIEHKAEPEDEAMVRRRQEQYYNAFGL